MKFKSTLALLTVLIGLALYTYYIEIPESVKKEREDALSKKVFPFEESDIQGLDLIHEKKTIKLDRVADQIWNLKEPIQYPANLMVVDQLIHQVIEAQITRVVEDLPKDLTPYGLNEPAYEVHLHLKDSGTRTLQIGDQAPVGETFFIKWAQEKRVILSKLNLQYFDKSANEFRDRTAIRFNNEPITGIDITYLNETQKLRKEEDQWSLVEGLKAKGDSDAIQNLLSSLRSAQIERFIEETPKDLGKYGLKTPEVVFKSYSAKGKITGQLHIGGASGRETRFAQNSPDGNVFTIGRKWMQKLSQAPVTFMDKTLLSFKETEVAEIRLRQGTETIQIKRDEKDPTVWSILSPVAGPADTGTVNSLLFDLLDGRAQQFFKESNLKLFGLKVPARELTLVLNNGKTESIRLGNSNGDQSIYFASRSSDEVVFALDSETVKKVFRSLHDLQNKKLLNFNSEDVSQILLEYPNQTFELNREGKGWRLDQPEKIDSLKVFVGKDILWTLGNLEYVATADKSLNKKYFGSPKIKITLKNTKSKNIGQLTVGEKVPELAQYYARVGGRDGTFLIQDRFLKEIPDDIKRFRPKKP